MDANGSVFTLVCIKYPPHVLVILPGFTLIEIVIRISLTVIFINLQGLIYPVSRNNLLAVYLPAVEYQATKQCCIPKGL